MGKQSKKLQRSESLEKKILKPGVKHRKPYDKSAGGYRGIRKKHGMMREHPLTAAMKWVGRKKDIKLGQKKNLADPIHEFKDPLFTYPWPTTTKVIVQKRKKKAPSMVVPGVSGEHWGMGDRGASPDLL